MLTVLGTSLIVAVFVQDRYPLLFLAAPVVIVHAVRHGLFGTAVSTIKTAVIAITATVLGSGPVMLTEDPWTRIIVLQLFLLSVFLTGIPVATLLKRQQDSARTLRRREAQIALLAASMSDAVLAFDARGRCRYAAGAAPQLLAMAEQRILESHAADLVEAADRSRFQAAFDRILDRSSMAETVTYRSPRAPGGTDTFLEAKLAATLDDERARDVAIVATVRDVTERVALERDLIVAREKAEQAALAKSQFLANMSHEIRTPMNGVLGFAELLKAQLDQPEQQRYAGMIVQSGRSMMHLLNDILDLSKVEVGLVTICEEAVDLSALLEECAALNRPLAARKGIALHLDPSALLAGRVLVDPFRIRQIVLNLLGNAVKFTEAGSVIVTAQSAGNRLIVSISDTGIGITPERLDGIFEPFEQADNTTSRRFGGTGLGLTISRKLARLMDGELTVCSEPGRGSRFTLELPLKAAPAVPAPAAMVAQSLVPAEYGRPRLLLVDDHEVNRELARAMLAPLGLTVDIVTNGEEAVAAVIEARAIGRPYRLVLMDIQMPVCDGYQATRIIRANGFAAAELPIVAMTANAFPEDIGMARDNGMQDHLAKPINAARLTTIVARWLRPVSDDSAAPAIDGRSQTRMAKLWRETRSAAVASAHDWIEAGENRADRRQPLQHAMHRISGTASHFGETTLGESAAAIDRAIDSGVRDEDLYQLVAAALACAEPAAEVRKIA